MSQRLDQRKLKNEIKEKGEVRLKPQTQWVAATSGRVFGAELRQRLRDECPRVPGNDGDLMAANKRIC